MVAFTGSQNPTHVVYRSQSMTKKQKKSKPLKIENESMVVLEVKTTVTSPVLVGTLLGKKFIFHNKEFHYYV
ncbi:hypothetical protein [Salmonella phage 7-11]|uniref:Uncharacterized protein n=1 Tax=Salmonella phage 7-11 TaxID=1054968 RepID=G0X561_9CAUD|nr:hypothetical protein SaPh711_gp128 [Salmonella phage 7-11]AEK82043.1 hypothetical protein [Salmonella phage 7-11]